MMTDPHDRAFAIESLPTKSKHTGSESPEAGRANWASYPTPRRWRLHGRERALVPTRRGLDRYRGRVPRSGSLLDHRRHPARVAALKLAAVAIAPLGKEIVSTNDPRATLGAISL